MSEFFDKGYNPSDILINLWNPLTDASADLIKQNIGTKLLGKNDYIYHIGNTPLYIYFVLKGCVKIFRNSDDGRPKIIRIFREEQFFGYRAYFAHENYSTNCVAMQDALVAMLPVDVISKLIDDNATVMDYFFKELAHGLGMSDDRIVSMSQKHLRGRLAETVLFLSKSFGTDNDGWIHGKITRRDIADLANMSTSNAIRTLTSFREEGFIDTDGKRIRIIQPASLAYVSGKE